MIQFLANYPLENNYIVVDNHNFIFTVKLVILFVGSSLIFRNNISHKITRNTITRSSENQNIFSRKIIINNKIKRA